MPDAAHPRLAGSLADRAQGRFDACNAGLTQRTRALLDRIAGDAALQPRLLNTLSMLEHMGSHRIMATQHGAGIGQATLRHLAEECQHAFFMKRSAERYTIRMRGCLSWIACPTACKRCVLPRPTPP